MNTKLCYLLPALSLAAALPAFAADTKSDEPKIETKARKEIRVISSGDGGPGSGPHRVIRRVGEPGEMETVTFLGVETGPVSPTLAAQLGLPDGAGLVVTQVLPNSPAAGALKRHDILTKFDDQILIEQRQLSVLVRGRKDGEEVTLTFLRGGKSATAKVKLAKHDVPKFSAMFNPGGPGAGPGSRGPGSEIGLGNVDVRVFHPDGSQNREDVNRVLSLIDAASVPGQRRIEISRANGPGDRNISVTVNTGNSRIISDDEKGSLELSMRDGKKELVAKGPGGEKIFSGPVNTPEERKALPAELRERLEKLEDMKQYSFRTDGDFQGAETKIMRPRGQGIALPPTPPARRPAQQSPLFF
jgi:serine protease Do